MSVEAAVWQEDFEPEQSLDYTSPPNAAVDAIAYSPDELKRHSWRFWFNQAGHDPREALTVTGTARHSYVEDDGILCCDVPVNMRYNDWLFRGAWLGRRLHYHRQRLICDKLFPCYRAPTEDAFWPWHLAKLPALLYEDRRYKSYKFTDLKVPAGATTNGQAAVNFPAVNAGWRGKMHSDFRDLPLPNIYPWYDQFVRSAVEIGRE
jgi:hypothetical protein